MYDLTKVYTWNDVDDLIKAKVEESPYLELKAGPALYNGKSDDDIKNEITKDVSALANSDGGLLIYGVKEKKNVADSFDYVDGNKMSKEKLQQIINSGI